MNAAPLVAALALLGISLYGLLVARHLIRLLIVLQVLAKAAILALVWAGRASGEPMLGQSLATTVIVADTVVAIIGLGLAVQIRQRTGTLDLHTLAQATSREMER